MADDFMPDDVRFVLNADHVVHNGFTFIVIAVHVMPIAVVHDRTGVVDEDIPDHVMTNRINFAVRLPPEALAVVHEARPRLARPPPPPV